MKRIKYIKTKRFFAGHPLYDAMQTICNPENEDSGVRYTYNNIEFSLSDTSEEYFDQYGKCIKRVDVLGLNDREDRWTVYRTFFDGNKETRESPYGKTEILKDENGNILRSIEYDTQGTIKKVYDSSQDMNSSTYGRFELQNDGKSIPSITYEYDEKGRISKEFHYENSSVVSWIYSNYYNEKGELIRQEQAYYGDGKFEEHTEKPHYTLVSVYTREYNDYGLCSLEYLYCEDGMQPDELTLFEYKYYD